MTPNRGRARAAEASEYRATGASLVATVLALLCFFGVVLLHLFRGDVDPVRQVMSEYANGTHGLIMTVVFYAFGLSTLALAFRLSSAIDRRWAAVSISVLLGAAGISLIASGVFEVERPLVPDTLEEIVHSNASVTAFVLIITSMLLFSAASRGDARWRGFRTTSTVLAVVASAAAVATLLTAETGWSGAVQRLLALSVLLWLVLAAFHLRGKHFRQA